VYQAAFCHELAGQEKGGLFADHTLAVKRPGAPVLEAGVPYCLEDEKRGRSPAIRAAAFSQ
jgi:hypothetical protein